VTGTAAPEKARPSFGIVELEVKGFRTAREVSFAPGALCALVGEANAGKSNLLAAIRAVLDSENAPLTASDVAQHGDKVSIRARLAAGGEVTLDGTPDGSTHAGRELAPPILFLSAEARAGAVFAPSSGYAEGPAAERLRRALARPRPSPAAQALSVLDVLASSGLTTHGGFLLLIEEPELYLRPQAQRYRYRVLRDLAVAGNQVIYSTHSPAFLNVARMDELVFVERLPSGGTRALQPEPVSADEDFRVMTEFDAARSELFLAQAVILVEGLTEKLALPFVFEALGYEPDSEGILVLETGGKANMSLFARICNECGIPYVVLHDRDAPKGRVPNESEQITNAAIAEIAGKKRIVQLVPDFEGVIGLRPSRNRRSRKPERAVRQFRGGQSVPQELTRAVEKVVAAARGRRRATGAAAAQPPKPPPGGDGATSAAPRAAHAPPPGALPLRARSGRARGTRAEESEAASA